MDTFGGMNVVVSSEAYETVAIFPDKPRTKRRNRRTIAKYGRLDRINPIALQTPMGLIVHPIIYHAMKKQARANASY